jgi:hypothetical protein
VIAAQLDFKLVARYLLHNGAIPDISTLYSDDQSQFETNVRNAGWISAFADAAAQSCDDDDDEDPGGEWEGDYMQYLRLAMVPFSQNTMLSVDRHIMFHEMESVRRQSVQCAASKVTVRAAHSSYARQCVITWARRFNSPCES